MSIASSTQSTSAPDAPRGEGGRGWTAEELKQLSSTEGRKKIDPAHLWMIVPAVVLFTGLLIYPLLQGIFYTFTNYQGYGQWRFVGLTNYINLFQDDIIWQSYGFTFLYAISATVLTNVIALFLAVMLNSKIVGRNGWRGLYFLPNILPVLIVAYIFSYLFTNNLPKLGQWLGWEWLSTSLLANEQLAWLAIVFVGVWQGVAFTTIIYLAGLQTIPEEVYEASSLDGAGTWKKFTQITFPLIMGFFTINVVLSFKNSLGVFDQVVAMTNGGPGTSTQSIAFLIFKNGFQGGEYAYQTANGVVYFIILIVLSFAQLKFLQSREQI
ncbi:sugar ABC transporter permease [Aestuariimicrobium sp. p3-SID1156]|uniref:carbohydrate ABC transporter permease n=1 Tax=Aestuariimicrobium sp. p3-SID1156 TaxID=2916038 RepID=UPI00223BF34E|nr:sugar ABC transporter permease [Aestuariimicrobium sp. p3-SID1156]MCT1460159.1 sugar ABC transporter permease [Aestuariimicrobium sp. p3-SID1156]